MTDGLGNSGMSRTFDHITGPTPVTVRDEAGCYVPSILPAGGVTMSPPTVRPTTSRPTATWPAQYLWGELSPTGSRNDALPNLSGTQPVRTYTIGFSVPDSDSARMLQDMAEVGGGEYLDAQSYQELYDSFDRIMTFIRSNAETSFRGITVQGDGLFTGNYVYQNSFQGVEDGHWFGNIKKFCLLPESNSNFDCLLEWDPAREDYVVNDAPLDLWSSQRGFATQTGGAGARLWDQLNPGMTAFDASVPSDPTAAATS